MADMADKQTRLRMEADIADAIDRIIAKHADAGALYVTNNAASYAAQAAMARLLAMSDAMEWAKENL